MGLIEKASVAIDGSKFKAVNNRDRNFTQAVFMPARTPKPTICFIAKSRASSHCQT
jgi:hypothetical protein